MPRGPSTDVVVLREIRRLAIEGFAPAQIGRELFRQQGFAEARTIGHLSAGRPGLTVK